MAARDYVIVLDILLPSLCVLDEPEPVARILRQLITRYQIRGKQIHDANIVAVMLYHGVGHLITYNASDFARFREISLVSPNLLA